MRRVLALVNQGKEGVDLSLHIVQIGVQRVELEVAVLRLLHGMRREVAHQLHSALDLVVPPGLVRRRLVVVVSPFIAVRGITRRMLVVVTRRAVVVTRTFMVMLALVVTVFFVIAVRGGIM